MPTDRSDTRVKMVTCHVLRQFLGFERTQHSQATHPSPCGDYSHKTARHLQELLLILSTSPSVVGWCEEVWGRVMPKSAHSWFQNCATNRAFRSEIICMHRKTVMTTKMFSEKSSKLFRGDSGVTWNKMGQFSKMTHDDTHRVETLRGCRETGDEIHSNNLEGTFWNWQGH